MKRLLKFGLVGVMNSVVDLGLFTVLVMTGTPAMLAQIISYMCGVANSYVWNRNWTFGKSSRQGRLIMARFAVLNLLALGVSAGMLFCLHEYLNIPVLYSKLASMAAGTMLGYAGSRYWVFKPGAEPVRETV
ncbi:GtrA family protein [Paenibacillus chartarius]|uniref:GtrA family protein n=1 Tax=Paenibacillus chartarius TaxID=747481 RepID=A0ABV6DU62_9BACL